MIIQYFFIFHLNQQIDLNKVVFQTFLLPLFFLHINFPTLCLFTHHQQPIWAIKQPFSYACLIYWQEILKENSRQKMFTICPACTSCFHHSSAFTTNVYMLEEVRYLVSFVKTRWESLISFYHISKASMNAVLKISWRRSDEWKQKRNSSGIFRGWGGKFMIENRSSEKLT